MNDATNRDDATTAWKIDPIHTTAGFAIRHLMVTNVRGDFERVHGAVRYAAGRPLATEIDVDIDVASIRTRDPQRDAHLKSADFFDVERHPSITFRSKHVVARPDGGVDAIGQLTIRGTSRDVTLRIDEVSAEQRDHNGKLRLGASARTTILRSDFGMTFNKALEAGGVALADEVKITLDVSLLRDEQGL